MITSIVICFNVILFLQSIYFAGLEEEADDDDYVLDISSIGGSDE